MVTIAFATVNILRSLLWDFRLRLSAVQWPAGLQRAQIYVHGHAAADHYGAEPAATSPFA
jgi:hypothetical protein